MPQHFFHLLLHEEDGQVLIEYGLLIALIALAVVSAITIFGKRMKNALYDNAAANLPG